MIIGLLLPSQSLFGYVSALASPNPAKNWSFLKGVCVDFKTPWYK